MDQVYPGKWEPNVANRRAKSKTSCFIPERNKLLYPRKELRALDTSEVGVKLELVRGKLVENLFKKHLDF
jgi:hypothetical protein